MATLNVKELGNKEIDLNRSLKMQEINIAVLTQIKKNLRGTNGFQRSANVR